MLNSYLLIAAIAFAAVMGLGGYRLGMKVERGEWTEREAKIQTDTSEAIQAAAKDASRKEHEAAVAIADVSAFYQAKLKEKDRARNAAVADSLINGLYVSAECPPGGNVLPGPAATAGGHNGGARVRLSDADAGFLLSEASRADKVVEQLAACQKVVTQDRKFGG